MRCQRCKSNKAVKNQMCNDCYFKTRRNQKKRNRGISELGILEIKL